MEWCDKAIRRGGRVGTSRDALKGILPTITLVSQTNYRVRQYIVFDAERLLARPVRTFFEADIVEQALKAVLDPGLSFSVESLPTARFVPYESIELPFIPQRVAVLVSSGETEAVAERAALDVRKSVEDLIDREGKQRVLGIGADVPIVPADFSCQHMMDVDVFGTRADAHRVTKIDQLPASFSGLTGAGVNVVIIDSGLDVALVPAGQWGGGWQPLATSSLPAGPVPGTTTGKDATHGSMILQNILAVAPLARIWDVPLIQPPRINDITAFLAQAEGTFQKMIADIASMPGQQWVFMNAWAIFDRRSEVPPGDYTENNPTGGGNHLFIDLIESLAAKNFDMVFCAGNCGGVCPDGRCGPNDFGPGRGIWGANAHAKVLTVGATRTHGAWMGYSSEGPLLGTKLANDKPDICAPSQYTETGGPVPANIGTSASAALACGVVTAFRSRWPQSMVPPSQVIWALQTGAGPVWTSRLGHGVLNARAAAGALP